MDISFAGFTLKPAERRLVGPDGPVELGARAVDLLHALLRKPNDLVSKDELLTEVWPGVIVEENALQAQISSLRKVLGATMIATVHGRGYRYAGPPPATVTPTAAPRFPPDDRKPVVAVLPFANLSGDAEQQFFSDGITEDVIDRLTRFRGLAVIGRHSAFALQGAANPLAEVRAKLGADYVVTGNVRRSGGRIRVAVRLSNALDETAIWAEHFDRPVEDIFAIQDDVAAIVAGRLSRHVEQDVGNRATGGRNLTSHELVLKGLWHFWTLTVEGHELGASYFRKALDVDPGNVEALLRLAACHTSRWLMFREEDDRRLGLKLGRRAAELAPGHALAQAIRAFTQLWAEGVEAARPAIRRAVTLNSGDSYVLADAALHAVYDGRPDEARAFLDAADRLNPIPPRWFAEYRGLLNFAEGHHAAAAPGFAGLEHCMFDTAYLVASLALTGDRAALGKVMQTVKARGWDLRPIAADEPYRDAAVRQRLAEGLALAYEPPR
jgi:TolB-like protein